MQGWTTEEINDLLTEEALLTYADVSEIKSTEKFYKVTETFPKKITTYRSLSSNNITDNAKVTVTEMDETDFYNEVRMHKYMDTKSCFAAIPNGKEVITKDSYMKMKVEKSKYSKLDYQISFRSEWLIVPGNSKIDIIGLGHDSNLARDTDHSAYFVYKANYDYYDMYGQPSDTNNEYVTYEPLGINEDVGGTVIKFNLLNDRSLSSDPYKASLRVTSHKAYMHYRAKVNKTSVTNVTIVGNYFHQQAAVSVSPSISYPLPGISFNYELFYKEMSPNPIYTWNIND